MIYPNKHVKCHKVGIPTTVIHAVEPGDVYFTEVQPLTNDIIEVWYCGCNCRDTFILIKGKRTVVHDGLIIVWGIHISDEVILIFVEIVLLSYDCRVILSAT